MVLTKNKAIEKFLSIFLKENSLIWIAILSTYICYISISGFTVKGKLTYGGNKLSIGFDTITISPPPPTPCWGLVLMCYNHLSIFSRTLYWSCVHPGRPSPNSPLLPPPTRIEERNTKVIFSECRLFTVFYILWAPPPWNQYAPLTR